jgi:hypothetical protein
MGWKKLKDAFELTHLEVVDGDVISLGSAYIPDKVKIHRDGGCTGDLRWLAKYYPDLASATKAQVAELLAATDVFERSLPVYAVSDGELREYQCEEYGWPNTTHCGQMMYDNRFFDTPDKAIANGIENAEAGLEILAESEAQIVAQLDRIRQRKAEYSRWLQNLRDVGNQGTAELKE